MKTHRRQSAQRQSLSSLVSGLTLRPNVTRGEAKQLLEAWLRDKAWLSTVASAPITPSQRTKLRKLAAEMVALCTQVESLAPEVRRAIITSIEARSALAPGIAHLPLGLGKQSLDELVGSLRLISAAILQTASTRRGRLPKSEFVGYVAELADIFEYLTGLKARRKISLKRGNRPYGEFVALVSAVWPLLPNSGGVSVDERLKRWDRERVSLNPSLWWLQRWALMLS